MLTRVHYFLTHLNGNGWNTQQFHELLRLSRDVFRFGCPGNYNVGHGESMLKFFCQKDGSDSSEARMYYFYTASWNATIRGSLDVEGQEVYGVSWQA
jgi:hypothetical protein